MSHLSPQQLDELKKDLEHRLAKLEDVTDTLAEEHPQAYADWANDNAESGEEALEAHSQLENETLENEADNMKIDIMGALQRMQAGSYGQDIETGEPIPFARLKLYPWATNNVQPDKKS